MKNLKIKVGSEAESKEAQELFFELGYKWFSGGKNTQHLEQSCSSGFGYLVAWSTGCFTNVIQCGCGAEDAKEITLQELRDMVNQDQDEPFLTPETTLNDQYAEIEQVRKHRHYFKDVSNIAEIDVYTVLKLFDVTDPCLQHIVKKALCAGKRGHKDMIEDLQNIVDTAIRAVELNS